MGVKPQIVVLRYMNYYNSKKDNLDCLLEYTVNHDCVYSFLENLTYITPDLIDLSMFCPEISNFLVKPDAVSTSRNKFQSDKVGVC